MVTFFDAAALVMGVGVGVWWRAGGRPRLSQEIALEPVRLGSAGVGWGVMRSRIADARALASWLVSRPGRLVRSACRRSTVRARLMGSICSELGMLAVLVVLISGIAVDGIPFVVDWLS